MMAWATLSRRLSLVFAVPLLVCCGASAWLQLRASGRHEQEVVQRLSGGLAAHIADNAELMRPGGLDPAAVKRLFDQLMAVNPSVEVYLLGLDGRIEAQAAPPGHLRRDRVDLAPVRRLLSGAPLPIVGDDPRNLGAAKVFSAAPLRMNDRDAGYVYVVLQGEDHDALAAHVAADSVLRTTLWSMALVSLLGLLAGIAAFRIITRPLRQLTAAVRRFESEGVDSLESQVPALARIARGGGDVALLAEAFGQMTQRIAAQWRELTLQDRQRRELFANVSHDLRTPLTSLHGYLETLRLKAGTLGDDERRRYLDIALDQSRKVGRLAQELFELARLEYGVVEPEKENFALSDLVQDVFQKFELAAEARQQKLLADIAPGLPVVSADLGMIERVLTNLLDNAVRHTPPGGEIAVQLRAAHGGPGKGDGDGAGVVVQVSDTGPGIPGELQSRLFTRPAFTGSVRNDGSGGGGLGLVFVQRILQLHGSDIRLVSQPGRGAVFRFRLASPCGA